MRFVVGDRVECRIGPHPVKGWAPGRVVKLYYSEPNWPPGAIAPYQVWLHDGRLIYAPQDVEQLIREREPKVSPDGRSISPVPPEHVFDYGDYEDEDEEGDNGVKEE